MTTAQVAARLHVSTDRVRQLDAELAPARCQCGARRYDPTVVEAYVAMRAAAAAELSRVRAARMWQLRARRRETGRRWREERRQRR